MIVLIGIGLVAGLVTALSPCVLPVLPILLAGGAAGRKPFRIIAGLVSSFVVFTLFSTWLLGKLGLPQDLLRNLAIALLFVVAATLIVPQFGTMLERPFASLTRHRAGGGGFVLGVSLGLVFVPCAGPVLAAVSVVAATNHVGWRAIVLTVAYALGAALPMLLIAIGGRKVATRIRTEGAALRLGAGVVIALVALGITFHLDDHFATAVPGYTQSFQKHIEDSSAARKALAKLRSNTNSIVATQSGAGSLPDAGVAPALAGTGDWFNTEPLTLAQLRGKVVLIDFWTYSCINCLRTLPHLKAWDATYRKDGLVIIGVHTPEFAFEHVSSNVGAAVKRLGIKYPVVQDNDYGTWDAYGNHYWPAEYLIERDGHVRHTHFGEGEYGTTEGLIRQLLGDKGKAAPTVPDATPTSYVTPESYLGAARIERYNGLPLRANTVSTYSFPKSLDPNELSYAGKWRIESERAVAADGAKLRLSFFAQHIYLVLGGKGRVDIFVKGKHTGSVTVDAYKLYTLYNAPARDNGLLELHFTPGVQAYAFTFG